MMYVFTYVICVCQKGIHVTRSCCQMGSCRRSKSHQFVIVSAARSLTCRDDLDSKWRLLLAENELSRVSLLSRISIGN